MSTNPLIKALAIELPIIQAPMAGVGTTALTVAVSEAGGLGSLALGNASVDTAREKIRQLKAATKKNFNVNFFCHQPAVANPAKEQRWINHFTTHFSDFSSTPPQRLECDYQSFIENPEMLAMLLEERPPVVSFHFGLPSQTAINALKEAGIYLLACATSLKEALIIEQAGLDAIIAQGYEAGGHRGIFEANQDLQLGLPCLLQILKQHCKLPIIATGGIMNGSSIASAMLLGASAAQLGTAFLLCPESATNASYRANLKSNQAYTTKITPYISGRPARGLANRFYALPEQLATDLPDYPIAYSLGKALSAAANTVDCIDFSAHWAGQAVPLIREMPAALLVKTLEQERLIALQNNS